MREALLGGEVKPRNSLLPLDALRKGKAKPRF
jgi:hypothetical protein